MAAPFRVTIAAENLYGGTGVHTNALADYLVGQGDSVQLVAAPIVSWNESGPLLLPNDPRVSFVGPLAGANLRQRYQRLGAAVAKSRPQVIYLGKGGPGDGDLKLDLRLALVAPTVMFEHDAPPTDDLPHRPMGWRNGGLSLGLHWRIPRGRQRLRTGLATRVLTNSESTRQRLTQFYGSVAGEVVPLGVDLQRFKPVEPLLPPTGGGIRLGLVGRSDVEMKGLDLAFAAIRQVGESGLPLAEVVFPVEASQQARIAALADAHGATPWLRIIDPVAPEELAALYSSLDGLLIASRFEGGPYTMLEAMACGTPVIATPVGLVPQVIDDGVNGIRVAATDFVPALVDGLQRFLARSAFERGLMGRAARDTIVRHHDAEHHFARLREILHEVARR